ncbi:MAG: PASTA domain-containing protein, partial [Oscillospiraceae bacterium]|nr:PASTA domain-containing protein [Oscillospiraceae bacterium]
AEEKKHSGYQGINISKNVKIRNVSDDPNSSSGTYMEYTREAETENADSSFSKYSSFSFTSSEKPAEEQSDTEEVKKKNEEARKEEAKKHLDESVDSILNFASGRSSVNLKKETAVSTDESADTEASEKNFISLTKSSDTPKETEPSAPLTKEEPEEVKAPEPQPEPEPVKEKVINYVGQEKKAAEQMIAFKGLVSEIEYVDDEKDFNFVIGQSIPADTEVLPGTTIKLTVSAGTWSEWEENPVPVSSNNFITETKTEYRKRSRTRSIDKRDTTDTSEFEDYTLTGQDSKYSDWEVDQYYSSEAVPPGPTCEIVRVTNGFKYAGWFNPANPGGMSFSSPDVANFFNTNLSNVKWSYEEIISEQNIKPDVKNWKLVTDNMNSTPAGDPMISNIFFSAHVVDGKSYAMKYGSAETEWYIYKKRALLETVYHFEKEIISDWSEWTEWAEKELTGSEDCQVEKRVLTRSRRKIPNA